MRRIDWDRVRRNRKIWRPDYREALRESGPPANIRFVTHDPNPPNEVAGIKLPFLFTQGPRPAGEVRKRLKSLGLKGRPLKAKVNQILTGKHSLAQAEAESYVERLLDNGFEMLPPRTSGNTRLLRFLKHGQDGAVQAEVTFTLKKPAKNQPPDFARPEQNQ